MFSTISGLICGGETFALGYGQYGQRSRASSGRNGGALRYIARGNSSYQGFASATRCVYGTYVTTTRLASVLFTLYRGTYCGGDHISATRGVHGRYQGRGRPPTIYWGYQGVLRCFSPLSLAAVLVNMPSETGTSQVLFSEWH